MNLALSSLTGPPGDVLLVNPDAEVGPAAIAALQDALRKDPALACVAPTLLDASGEHTVRSSWPFPAPGRAWLDALGFGRLVPQSELVIGAVLMLAGAALLEVGEFDERFFLYAEETDWQRRAIQLGWQIGLVEEASARHVGGGTGGDRLWREAAFLASVERYIRKWYGWWGWASFRTAASLAAARRTAELDPHMRAAAGRRLGSFLRRPERVALRLGVPLRPLPAHGSPGILHPPTPLGSHGPSAGTKDLTEGATGESSPEPASDVEASPDWLDGLLRLNQVIAQTGIPLEGNLCYEHRDSDYLHRPPDPLLRAKRDRFREVVNSHTHLLEIGVNGGHSAYVALTANPKLAYHGVDICFHGYVRPAIAWLQSEFPGRVSFTAGNSLRALPELRRQGQRFDAVHIDGAKFAYFADIIHAQQIVDGSRAVVIVDDTNGPLVADTWRRCLRRGLVAPLADFPTLAPGSFSNEVARLVPPRPGRSGPYLAEAVVRRRAFKIGQAVRRVRRRVLGLPT